MPVGRLLLDPAEGANPFPSTNVSPAQTEPPVEHVNAWKQFLGKMKTDPNFKQAVLQTGLNLMKGPAPGQNGWSLAGQALGTGVDTLQMMREKDRLQGIQEQERNLRTEDTRSQIRTRNTGAQNETARTGAYVDSVKDTSQQGSKRLELAAKELDETIRHNKAGEGNDAKRNAAYATAASGGGSNPSADVVKIQNLTEQYKLRGLSDVDAKAKATREVMTTGKNTSAGAQLRELVQQKFNMWSSAADNMFKSPPPELQQQWIDSSKKEILSVTRQGDAMSDAANPPEGGPSAVGVLKPSVDPVMDQVVMLRTRGFPPEKIKELLVQDGHDPTKYGY